MLIGSPNAMQTPALHTASGFTAIELMVVVAIVAILTALAAPSFATMVESWRVRLATEHLQSTLYYARSEAIKRGGRVAYGCEGIGLRTGTIVGSRGGYLRIRLDGEKVARNFHPEWNIAYLTHNV